MVRPSLRLATALLFAFPWAASAVETQLTSVAASDQRPAWCPDGAMIAFDSDRSGNRDLWMIPSGGGTAVQLTTSLELDQHPDWSPECDKIVFSASVGGGNPDLYILDLGVGTPVLLDSDPGSLDRFPAWSPDSSKIAYSKGNDIYVIPVTGGTPLQVTTDAGIDLHPTWSPDGTQLAFLSNRSGNNDIWVIPSTGGVATQITTDPSNDGAPDWSPDGTTIAFQSQRAGNNDIWTIPAAGGTAIQATTDAANDVQPEWAPNGSQIVFSRNGNLWVVSFPGADIGVTKVVDGATRNVGTLTTYTIVVQNHGPDVATNVEITDLLPAGLTLSNASTTVGSYTSGTGTWAIASLAVGDVDTLTIEAVVDPSAAGTTIFNTASVTASDQPDNHPANDSSTVAIVVPSVDLALSKSVNNPLPNEGAAVAYTLILTNAGPDVATGVQVTDLLPAGLTFVSATPSQGTYDDVTGIWDVGTVSTVASLGISTTVDAGTAGTTITNNTAVTASDQGDSNLGNDSDAVDLTVQSADLAVTKSVDDPNPNEGQFIDYTIVLENNGPFTAVGVVITDVLPAGVTFQSASTTQGSYNSGTGAWSLGNMVNSTVDTLTITAQVDAGTGGSTIVNTAGVSAVTQADAVPGNNSDSASITVAAAPVAVEMQLTTAGSDQRPAWCPDGAEIAFDSNRSGNRDLWAIPPGGGAAIQLTTSLEVDQHAEWSPDCSQVVFSATVGGGNPDLYLLDRQTLVATLLHSDPGSSDRFPSWSPDGSTIAYTKDTDIYLIPATGGTPVQLTTDPGADAHPTWSPDGTQIGFLSNRSGNNDIWVIPATGGVATQITTDPANDGAPDWSPNGAQIAFQSQRGGNNDVWVIPATGGVATQLTTTLDNDVQPDWAPNGGEIVFARSNNLWKLSIGGVDVKVKKSVDVANPQEGDTVTFTVAASNLGPDAATGVEITDLLPAGLTHVSSVATSGSYVVGSGVWTIGAMANGQADTLTVSATVDAGTSGSTLVNTASVTGVNETDGNPFDDTSSASVTVQSVDLAVTKTVDDSAPGEGDTVVYTVTVTNNGPDTATSVDVTDLLPAGVTFVSSTPSAGSYDDGTGLWTIGAVAASVFETLDITVTVDAGTDGNVILNTASLTASTPGDVNGANDSDDASITVTGALIPEMQLTTAGSDQRPAWCPDGAEIAFDSNRSGNRDLWAIPPGGGAAIQLTTSLEVDQHAEWSPDCSQVVFSATVGGGNPDLYLLDRQTLVTTLLHSDPASSDRFPSWSPDGTTIAYTKDTDIYLIPATGGTPVQLTTDPGADAHPTWSPDGTQIGFLSNRSGNNDIWVIPAAGGVATQITTDPANDGAPDWSPNGAQIAFQSQRGGNNDVWVIPATGGVATQLTTTLDNDVQPDWAPNGGEIVFARSNNLWKLSIGGVDVKVKKSVDVANPQEGDTVTFTVAASNLGPDAATGVEITDLLPAGLTHVSSVATSGSYVVGSGVWTIGAMANGQADTLTVSATVDAGTSGSTLVNTASVTGVNETDGNPFDDTSSASVTVQSVDLAVTKTVDDSAPGEGDTVVYTVTVTNNGPDNATAVDVTDLLPAGVTFVSSAPSAGSYDDGTGLWTVGAVAASGFETLDITATVDAGTDGNVVLNTASLTASTPGDVNGANDSDDASLTVTGALIPEMQLTTAGSDQRPAWCPDGAEIAFDSNRSGNRDLWAIPPGGGAAIQLTTNLEVDQHAEWSPDCSQVVFSATVGGGNPDLYLLDRQTLVTTLLHSDPGSSDRFPSWSPDGSTIAYTKDTDIYLIPATGGTPVQLTTDPGADAHPTWSPDGTQIGFLSNRSGNNDIWVIPATGGVATQITTDPANDGAPDWSPNGAQIAFQSQRGGNNDVWVIPATGGVATQLTTTLDNDVQPDWAPNGGEIVFARSNNLWKLSIGGVDVKVKKSVDVANPQEGDTVTFTVAASNLGPDAATGVEITDLLPAGLTHVSSVATSGSYVVGSGVWTIGAMANGQADTLTVSATVDAGTSGSTLVNTASVTGVNETDGNPFDDTSSASVTVQAIVDLAVTKTVDNATPNEGGTVVYTVTLTNNGPDAASGVDVTDLLPAGVTFVSSTPSVGSYDDGTGLWTVGAVAASASETLTITATVDAATAGSTITNTAAVSASDQTDANAANDSDSADVTVQSIDLAVTKTVDNATPNEGGAVIYTVTLTNNGPDAASGVDVTDLLPAGVTFVSSTPSVGSYDDGTGLWTAGAVAASASETLTITATVDAATAGSTITNTAAVSASDQTDSNAANDSDSADVTVQSIDLAVTKTVDNATPNEGGTVIYTVTLTNNGPDAASGVDVTDLLPAGVTFVSSTPSAGSYDDGTGLWTVGAVAASASETLTITATVDAATAGSTITNTAAVSASDQTDANAANDSDSADVTVQSIDLAVTKTVDNATPNEGGTVIYTVTLTNNGPDAASGVDVTDLLPAGVTFVSSTPSAGSYDDGTGLWTVGAVAASASEMLTITATVDAATAGSTITNTASVSASDQTDANAANDSDSADVTVQSIDLAVTKTVDNATPNEGGTVVYTVTLTNNGPDAASGVDVTDLLPAGVTFVSSTPSVGSYDDVTGLWTVGAVAASASETLTITATVDAATAGSTITNTAAVSASDQSDANAANDSDSADVTVQSIDLAVTKTVDNATPNEGGTVVYTVTLTNNGPDAASGVDVTDLLPAGVTFVSSAPSVGSYDDGTGLWTVGAVAASASETLNITATVDAATAGSTITNTAAVSASDQTDANAANDSDSADVTVQSIDLAVTKTVDNATPNEGGAVIYTVTLTNNGPDAASGVDVTDLLPAGVTFVSSTPSVGSYDDVTGLWTVGAVAASASETLTITATVDAATAGSTITNTAAVSASDQSDANAANDSDSADVTVQSIDLAVTKTVDNATPNEGGTVVYTVTLTNNGPDAASGVDVTDLLPTGVTFVSSTPSAGSYDDGTGLWTVGAVAASASETLTITATVDAATAGSTITNTAAVSASDQTDANAVNDTDSASITVLATDIAIVKTVSNPAPSAGAVVTYTIVASNQGPLLANSVGVQDVLPAGLTFQGWSATQGTYNSGSGTWAIGSIGLGGADTLQITALVNAGTEGTLITNTASLLLTVPGDSNPVNNVATAPINVANVAFASLSSQVSRTFVVGSPTTTASPMTVAEHATVNTITALNDIRVRIPVSLGATWDASITTATLAGSGAGKVSGTVSYEDAGRTLLLDVTADFAPGETVTVSGLALSGFGAPAGPKRLELETANDASTAATDDKTLTVLAVGPMATRSTAIDVTPNGDEIWVVNPDHASVSVLAATGVNKNTLLSEIGVGREPWSLAIHPTNNEVWVTSLRDDHVYIVDAGSRTVVDSIAAGYETFGVAFNPAGDLALVTASGSDEIFLIDVATRTVTRNLADSNTIERRPRGIVWRADGQRAYVSHLLTHSDTGLLTAVFAGSWTTHNINVDAIVDEPELNGYPSMLQNMTMAPAPGDSVLWIPTDLLNTAAGQLSGQDLTPTNAFHAVVRGINIGPSDVPDLDQETYYLSESGTDVGGPIAVDFKHGKAYVANLHSNNVTVLTDGITNPNELGVVDAGQGPIGVAAHASTDRVYVANWLSRNVTVIDCAADSVVTTVATTTSPEPLSANELNGKQLFFDSTGPMSSNDQASCASCHVLARNEARTWDLSQFGGHQRATPDLRGAGETSPHNWTASMDELADQNAKIVDLTGGAGLLPGGGNAPLGTPNTGISQDMDDIGLYVASLRHRPDTPFLVGGVPTAEADLGEILFNDPTVGCAGCHSGPRFSDSSLSESPFLRHDVGTADSTDAQAAGGFDTPSLLGIWDTAPYLHDNRAATLEEVLTVYNPADQHGQTSQLSGTDIANLVAYLRSIRPIGLPFATGAPDVGPLVTRTHFDRIYPNPFRAETSLRFSIKEDFADVAIEIFDIQGRRVRSLLDRTMTHGSHIVGWDSRNGQGRWVAPGTYFVRLRVNGQVTGDKKMTVLR